MSDSTTRPTGLGKHAEPSGAKHGGHVEAIDALPVTAATDSTQTMTAAIGATLTGGGSYTIPVFYDGAAWRGL